MLFVIDIGNTHTAMGVLDGICLAHHWRIATSTARTGDECGVLLDSLFRLSGVAFSEIHAAILASVVPPAVASLRHAAERYLGVQPLVVGPGIRTGMPILYDNPREVGADRIVNAVAAYERCHSGALVVDFGTATTFDVITPRGEYLGGAIAPGVSISAEALYQRAAKLPRVEIALPASVLGKNTVGSMQSGIYFGYVALVDGLVTRFRRELPFPVRVFATGGLAPTITANCETVDEVDPNLTLDGLRILWERNQP